MLDCNIYVIILSGDIMIYLKNFSLLDENQEYSVICYEETRNIFNNYYPTGIFPKKHFKDISFSDVTCFYGGNGSGKTTLLNIISDSIGSIKKTNYDKGSHFNLYVNHCNYDMTLEEPLEIKTVTSDDVFDYLIDIRSINSNINRRKDTLSKDYLNAKFTKPHISLDNYEELKKYSDSRAQSMSKYVRERLRNNNIVEQSNGESALLFWEKEIKENAIYILDEPENSLSAENQLKLKKFIEESVRFFNCQFIISTHSPFLLSLDQAKIYDLDSNPVTIKKWTELPNVRIYYDFFKKHDNEF